MLLMKISRPIAIKITPPRISALLESFVPNRLPRERPDMEMKNVTVAMIREQTRAISQSYSAMVKPTDKASMEVATP